MMAVASFIIITSTLAAGTVAATADPPVEVFMKGDNVTGDSRFYNCFRIPQLLTLHSGTILAFAEGRADGCRPDVNRNRPALPDVGTNYPGAVSVGKGDEEGTVIVIS